MERLSFDGYTESKNNDRLICYVGAILAPNIQVADEVCSFFFLCSIDCPPSFNELTSSATEQSLEGTIETPLISKYWWRGTYRRQNKKPPHQIFLDVTVQRRRNEKALSENAQ